MKFDLINPSDAYTLEAKSLKVAAVACCLLGNGKYGLTGLGDAKGQDVPIFLFSGHDEWFAEKFGLTYEATAQQVLDDHADDLAQAFDSVTLTRGKRSSMNNIGAAARDLSKLVRAKEAS